MIACLLLSACRGENRDFVWHSCSVFSVSKSTKGRCLRSKSLLIQSVHVQQQCLLISYKPSRKAICKNVLLLQLNKKRGCHGRMNINAFVFQIHIILIEGFYLKLLFIHFRMHIERLHTAVKHKHKATVSSLHAN